MNRPPLVHEYPQWETLEDDPAGEAREVWRGAMRIVRNRRRIRKLKKRGVPMMDLRAFTSAGYLGKREAAWFVAITESGESEHHRGDLL